MLPDPPAHPAVWGAQSPREQRLSAPGTTGVADEDVAQALRAASSQLLELAAALEGLSHSTAQALAAPLHQRPATDAQDGGGDQAQVQGTP